MLGTSVLTPVVPLQPGGRRAGVRHARLPRARAAMILGVGTGESMNEVPVGVDWPEQSERFARLRESVELIQQLWREEFVTFEGEYYRTHDATVYDRPDEPGADLHRGLRAGRRAPRRPRRATASSAPRGKGAELYTETLLPARRRGRREGRPRRVRDGPDDRDEGLLRHRPRAGDGGHQGLGGARADRRAEDGRPRPARDGEAGEAGRAVRAPALAGRPRTRTSTSSRSRRTSATGSTTWSSTSRATTRRPRSPATARSSCRGCARGSADDGRRSVPDARGAARAGGRLALPSCSEADALAIGRWLLDRATERSLPVTIEVWRGARLVFRAARPGTNAHNDLYLAGKRRVVEHFGHSSFYERQRHVAAGTLLRRGDVARSSRSTRPTAAASR